MKNVSGGTPWTREAVATMEHRFPEAAATLDADVPTGHHIFITAVNGRAGSWGAMLLDEKGDRVAWDRYGHPTVAAAAYRVLRLAREGATDA